MTITAKVITDSINQYGDRLTTMQLRYPRFIHAEFMTHRVFSRNASSSRAIPVERLIADIENDPVVPSFWGKNQVGMQAREQMSSWDAVCAESTWHQARFNAIASAQTLHAMGAHKQIVNRILEPFSHINVIVSATEWANFYALRRHPDAQPEIKILADAMWEAQQASTPANPKQRRWTWHLPYIDYETFPDSNVTTAIKCSVARCARVSYLTHEGKEPKIEDDLKLYERLVGNTPLHASPAEHQAMPDPVGTSVEMYGNFVGWLQYRKTLPNENIKG